MDRLTSTHAREGGVLSDLPSYDLKRIEAEIERLAQRSREKAQRLRVTCGAMTRKGRPCRMKSEPGRSRCKFHGGKSTGPKTEAGKARIAQAQRERWKRWREARGH
ncbi:MAG: HGGxSTG domain-containing protein [Arenibacterium sp.]